VTPIFKQTSAVVRRSAQVTRVLGTIAVLYAAGVAALFLAGRSPRHRAEAACYIAAALIGLSVVAHVEGLGNDDVAQRRRSSIAMAVLGGLVCLSFVLFGASLGTGLLSDDFVLLDRAARGFLTSGNELFRPGPQLVWFAAERILRLDAAYLHALSVGLHGVNAGLVFVLATLVGLAWPWAICAAGLFLIGAACVETVVWLAALFDICLVTGSLLFAIGALRRSWTTAFVGLAIALLSKETAIVSPILGALVTMVWGGSWRIPTVGTVVTIVFATARLWMLPPPHSYWIEPSGYVLKEMVSRVFGSLAIPWTSSETASLHLLPTLGILSIATIVVAAAQRPMTMRTVAGLSALVVWVVVAVGPIYGGFYVAPTLEGSRYLYLPSVGWSLLIAMLASQAGTGRAGRAVVVPAMAALLVTGALGAVRHQRPWVEAAALRDAVLQSARGVALAHGCPSIDVKNPPDSVDGAYVFRNGIREALVRATINTEHDLPRGDCLFEWSAGRLVPAGRP
jgi:hypothetical protein